MNSIKEKCLALHAEGYSTRTIAKMLGISKSTAHYHVSTPYIAQQNPGRKDPQRPHGEKRNQRIPNSTCVFSSSCFSCPLGECKVSEWKAPRVNRLPKDFDYVKEVEGV